VYIDPAGTPAARRRGLYLKILDLDVVSSEELAAVLESSVMLGPLHTTDDLVKEASWKMVGNVPPTDDERNLPYFLDGTGVVDYFFNRVADTPENRAKVIEESVVPPEWVTAAVRAKRGLEQWRRGYDSMLPRGG
jgi:hypothetical protein